MTIELAPGAAPPIDLAGFLAGIEAMRFDADCEQAYADAAPLLAALGRDRRFLGDLMIEELGHRAKRQEAENDYGPQVLLLHRGPGWFVRANIWPDTSDPLYRASGPRRFFYGVPHDHNFTFLTVGYHGPGYWSDYYEHDADAVLGVPGEPAALRFVERSRLSEGRILLYRAYRDVHDQHPPDKSSISLNIVQGTPGRALTDQYRFDLDTGLIAEQLAFSPTEALLALMPALGGAEGAGLLDDFARSHPSERIRFGAIAAQSKAAAPQARAAILERACADGSRRIATLARSRLIEIENARELSGEIAA